MVWTLVVKHVLSWDSCPANINTRKYFIDENIFTFLGKHKLFDITLLKSLNTKFDRSNRLSTVRAKENLCEFIINNAHIIEDNLSIITSPLEFLKDETVPQSLIRNYWGFDTRVFDT